MSSSKNNFQAREQAAMIVHLKKDLLSKARGAAEAN